MLKRFLNFFFEKSNFYCFLGKKKLIKKLKSQKKIKFKITKKINKKLKLQKIYKKFKIIFFIFLNLKFKFETIKTLQMFIGKTFIGFQKIKFL